jgi:hypothetical protein
LPSCEGDVLPNVFFTVGWICGELLPHFSAKMPLVLYFPFPLPRLLATVVLVFISWLSAVLLTLSQHPYLSRVEVEVAMVVNSLFSGGQDPWTEGRGCRCAPFLFFALIRGCTLYHCPSVGRDRSPVDVFICCGFEDLLIPDQGPRSLLFPGFRISGAEFDVILL